MVYLLHPAIQQTIFGKIWIALFFISTVTFSAIFVSLRRRPMHERYECYVVRRLISLIKPDCLAFVLFTWWFFAMAVGTSIVVIMSVLIRLGALKPTHHAPGLPDTLYTDLCGLLFCYFLGVGPGLSSAVGTAVWWLRLKRLGVEYVTGDFPYDSEVWTEGKIPDDYASKTVERFGKFVPGYLFEVMHLMFFVSGNAIAIAFYTCVRAFNVHSPKLFFQNFDGIMLVTMASGIASAVAMGLWYSRRKYVCMPRVSPISGYGKWTVLLLALAFALMVTEYVTLILACENL
ncbi:hypothetical protein [Methanopyrus kandleri]